MFIREFASHYTSFDVSKENSWLKVRPRLNWGNCDKNIKSCESITRCSHNITSGSKFIKTLVAFGPGRKPKRRHGHSNKKCKLDFVARIESSSISITALRRRKSIRRLALFL